MVRPWRAVWERVQHLAAVTRAGLAHIPGVTVRDVGQVQCGIVSFSVEGCSAGAPAVAAALRAARVNVWTSKVCFNTRLEFEGRDMPQVGPVADTVHRVIYRVVKLLFSGKIASCDAASTICPALASGSSASVGTLL